MAILIENYRAIFFFGRPPEGGPLVLASVISILFCGFGYYIYHRQLHDVIDSI
jgi:ABC-2 type transport system permease protein/lipopolysaccharide transport system permease protein